MPPEFNVLGLFKKKFLGWYTPPPCSDRLIRHCIPKWCPWTSGQDRADWVDRCLDWPRPSVATQGDLAGGPQVGTLGLGYPRPKPQALFLKQSRAATEHLPGESDFTFFIFDFGVIRQYAECSVGILQMILNNFCRALVGISGVVLSGCGPACPFCGVLTQNFCGPGAGGRSSAVGLLISLPSALSHDKIIK